MNQQQELTTETRWTDERGRVWRIVEKMPFGRNLCTTTDDGRKLVGEWTHNEIRAAIAKMEG